VPSIFEVTMIWRVRKTNVKENLIFVILGNNMTEVVLQFLSVADVARSSAVREPWYGIVEFNVPLNTL